MDEDKVPVDPKEDVKTEERFHSLHSFDLTIQKIQLVENEM